ncbi:MAG: hypothetical protein LBD59_00055 [Prevotellaceae bacterium]|nr:hypothetical protein [Prevotellaceae bacterium]
MPNTISASLQQSTAFFRLAFDLASTFLRPRFDKSFFDHQAYAICVILYYSVNFFS